MSQTRSLHVLRRISYAILCLAAFHTVKSLPVEWEPPCSYDVTDLPGASFDSQRNVVILNARIHIPKCGQSAPLVLFHSGFLGKLEFYSEYAELLASWGLAVLQYDMSCKTLVGFGPCGQLATVRDEASWMLSVLDWARHQDSNSSWPVRWDTVAVAGHSRGGDVAFHSLASYDVVKAAVLIDPVMQHPHLPIEVHRAFLMITGRGGSCCPNPVGPAQFAKAAGSGSMEVHIPEAGHAQFEDAPTEWQWLFDRVCGRGSISDEDVLETASILTAAWLVKTLRHALPVEPEAVSDGLLAYDRWMTNEIASGAIIQTPLPRSELMSAGEH